MDVRKICLQFTINLWILCRQLPVPQLGFPFWLKIREKALRKGTISNMAQSVVSPQGTVEKNRKEKRLGDVPSLDLIKSINKSLTHLFFVKFSIFGNILRLPNPLKQLP